MVSVLFDRPDPNIHTQRRRDVQFHCFSVDCSVPQGSVLDPRCFVSYTEDVADLLEQHAVQSHMYADDTQFHDSCRPDDIDTLLSALTTSIHGARLVVCS